MGSTQRAVVIGAGITGTLTALELIDAGFAVTLLEAAHVGAGSSSRTAAGIRQQFSTPDTVRGMRYAVRAYRAFDEGLPEGAHAIVQSGYLFLLAPGDRTDAERRVAVQQGAGLAEVELLDPDAVVERFPWVARDAIDGATWCPTDGFLHPEVVYGEAARRAGERGATVLQHAPVTGAIHAGGRLRAVETPKGRHEADLFVDATNAWTPRLATLLGAEALPVSPLKRYLWFLQRGEALSAETLAAMPLVISPQGTYCRPESGQSLLMGHRHDAAPEPDFTRDDQDRVEPAFDHRSGFDGLPYTLWAELAETLPAFAELAGIHATTAGYYAATPDHNPFLGFDRQIPNLLRLVGFSGHGAMFGPFTARVARALAEAGHDLDQMVLDGEPVGLDAFRIGRDLDRAETMVI